VYYTRIYDSIKPTGLLYYIERDDDKKRKERHNKQCGRCCPTKINFFLVSSLCSSNFEYSIMCIDNNNTGYGELVGTGHNVYVIIYIYIYIYIDGTDKGQ